MAVGETTILVSMPDEADLINYGIFAIFWEAMITLTLYELCSIFHMIYSQPSTSRHQQTETVHDTRQIYIA